MAGAAEPLRVEALGPQHDRRSFDSGVDALAVIVDAKDHAAVRFTAREAFLPFPDQPLRLFRPMSDIAALYA